MKVKKEKSCGCIIIKDNKVLLIQSTKSTFFWGFPKGHVEGNETELETATREVKEEVGLDVEINKNKRYEFDYITDNGIDKTVVLYLAKPKSEKIVIQESEVKEAGWYDFNNALDMLSFDDLKSVFKEFMEEIWKNFIKMSIYQPENIEVISKMC